MIMSVAYRPSCPNGAVVQLLPGYARLSGSTSLARASASPCGDKSRSFKVGGAPAAAGGAARYGLSLLVTLSPFSWWASRGLYVAEVVVIRISQDRVAGQDGRRCDWASDTEACALGVDPFLRKASSCAGAAWAGKHRLV